MSTSKYGALRKWFLAAQDSGDFIGIRYGFIKAGASTPEWIYLPHTDFDGIGAFAEILRSRGVVLGALPQIKYYPAYSAVMSAVKHWPRYALPRRPLRWQEMKRDSTGTLAASVPAAVSWHVFDEERTTRLRFESRKRCATVNTILLQQLNEAIRPSLVDSGGPIPWMIPVNMRGGVSQHRDTDNHTSYVTASVAPGEAPGSIHRRILWNLSRGQHWGNWHAFKSGHITPHPIRKWMVSNGLAIAQWNVGAFSNLGDWFPDAKTLSPAADGDWLFAPPTLRTQLLGAGCVTVRNRMGLVLQAHPELTVDPDVVRRWMDRWVAGVEAMVG